MAKNTNLKTAKKSKNDEFYTLMEDIEKELRYYTESFQGKVVYCNCDDYQQSNFYKYFYYNFHYLKLKKLICTCFNKDDNGLYAIFDGEIETTGKLNGDGDFRSEECIEYLKQADVVVTNPPFSLFRQYVKQLMDYGKKFIIIGNKNALTYKEVFSFIKENKLWLGITNPNDFIQPSYAEKKSMAGLTRWFTNIENKRRNEPIDLYKRYSFEEYPKFDNFDAINVDKVSDIPMDYDGIMAVPITFLDRYCPTQFEIIDARAIALNDKQKNKSTYLIKDADGTINGKPTYARICIKKIQ